MMGCTHVGLKVNSLLDRVKMTNFKFECSECATSRSLWLCMTCGVINCGRYVNGHMINHYESNKDHMVSMSMETASLYCYGCNDDVEPDTDNGCLDWLRRYVLTTYENYIGHLNTSSSCSPSSTSSSINEVKTETCTEDADLRILSLRPRSKLLLKNKNKVSHNINRQSRKNTVSSIRKNQVKAIGLRNLGNTCFMNAVLQSLNNIHPFSLYIKKLPSFENINGSIPGSKKCGNIRQTRSTRDVDDVVVAEELRKILVSLNEEYVGARRNAISPESLFFVIWKVVPRFRGYQQQDAHEFLRYMLDRLHTELLLLLPEFSSNVHIGQRGRASIVTCVFGGVLQNEVVCLNCSSVSKKQDPFLDLSLDIPDKYLQRYLTSKRLKTTVNEEIPVCQIRDCLASFVEVEELADTELYYCANCKGKQRSTKRFWIRRLPNVLCLHLKRFRWINYYRTKIDTTVTFPVESLDMSEFILRDIRDTRQSRLGCCLYDLAAIIVHHGSGVGSGHYTAFAVHNGQWFHFNDSSVQPISRETVENCKPYILFYVRKEVRLPKLFTNTS